MSDEIRLRALRELRKRGVGVLGREVGTANALRFLHSYDVGRGDYTRERDQWLSARQHRHGRRSGHRFLNKRFKYGRQREGERPAATSAVHATAKIGRRVRRAGDRA